MIDSFVTSSCNFSNLTRRTSGRGRPGRAAYWWRGCLLQAWCRRLARAAASRTSGTRPVSATRTAASSRWAPSASATTCSSAYPGAKPRSSRVRLDSCDVSFIIFQNLCHPPDRHWPIVAIFSFGQNINMPFPLTCERCTI